MNKVLVLSGNRLHGPFPDQEIATAWVGGHTIRNAQYLMFNTATADGTAETAQECGQLLTDIDTATAAPIHGNQRRTG